MKNKLQNQPIWQLLDKGKCTKTIILVDGSSKRLENQEETSSKSKLASEI